MVTPSGHFSNVTMSGITVSDRIQLTDITSFASDATAYQTTEAAPPPDQIILWVCFVLTGIVIISGLFFDILSIVVFLTSRTLRKTTTGHYLVALMFADTSFLIGEFLKWLTYTINGVPPLGLNFTNQYDVVCRMVYFIRYSAKLSSAWLTVVITLERFLTVSMPLRVGQISTTAKAKGVIAGLLVLCTALTLFPFWTVGVLDWKGINYCLITDEPQYENWSMVILRVGSLGVPCVIILFLTIAIIVQLYRADRMRQTMSSASGKSVQKQLTAMLLAVAISFVILRLPYMICWYLNQYAGDLNLDKDTEDRVYEARLVTDVIATANYGSNFFLFCVCGSSFREQLGKFFGRKKRGGRLRCSSNTLSSRVHSNAAGPGSIRKDTVQHTYTAKKSSAF